MSRLVWIVALVGALHLGYHLTHLERTGSTTAAIGSAVALTVSLGIGVALVAASWPRRRVAR